MYGAYIDALINRAARSSRMSQKIYLADVKKGAMYQNRSMLKERGFKFDPGKKSWYSDAPPIDGETLEALRAVNISIAGEEIPVPATGAEPAGETSRFMPVSTKVTVLAVEESMNFNSGAYLHSRVKNKKPVDEWFVGNKCRPGNYFDSMYPGAKTVIQQVQTAGMNGQPIKPVLWLFVCDTDGNVLARLKTAEKTEKEKN